MCSPCSPVLRTGVPHRAQVSQQVANFLTLGRRMYPYSSTCSSDFPRARGCCASLWLLLSLLLLLLLLLRDDRCGDAYFWYVVLAVEYIQTVLHRKRGCL
ncbi:hypothetical protein ACKS0A_02306 [Histoplasma ohiense]